MLSKKNISTVEHRREGFSLIETSAALVLAVMLMSPVVGVLHSSIDLRDSSSSRLGRTNALHNTLRHLRRQLKECSAAVILSSQGNRNVGEFLGANGQVYRWEFDKRSGELRFRQGGQAGLLSEGIDSFQIDGFDSNGRSTTVMSDIQVLRCTLTVRLENQADEVRTSHSWINLRRSS